MEVNALPDSTAVQCDKLCVFVNGMMNRGGFGFTRQSFRAAGYVKLVEKLLTGKEGVGGAGRRTINLVEKLLTS